jgi:hypothetical protein
VEAFGVLIKFKMALPWKPRYQKKMGWGDVRYCFAMGILIIIIVLLLSFFGNQHAKSFHTLW